MNILGGGFMDSLYRTRIRQVLREHLLGKENQGKIQEIMEKLGVSHSTIKTWTATNGIGIPVTEDLPVLCEILGITLYQLFDIPDPSNLSDAERELIMEFRNASKELQKAARNIFK